MEKIAEIVAKFNLVQSGETGVVGDTQFGYFEKGSRHLSGVKQRDLITQYIATERERKRIAKAREVDDWRTNVTEDEYTAIIF